MAVLEFIELYIAHHGRAPSQGEITQRFQFKSTNQVVRILDWLEFNGYIKVEHGKRFSISLGDRKRENT